MTIEHGEALSAVSVGTLSVAALVGVVASALGTAMSACWARRVGLVSTPNPIVVDHDRPVAYLGGIGIAIGMIAGLLALHAALGTVVATAYGPLLACAIVFMTLGVFDDAKPWSPRAKFVGQAMIAAAAVALGIHAPIFGIELVDRVVCVVWIVGVVNAFNFIDVSDGLLASVSLGICGSLAVAYPDVAPMAVVTAAACVGFLPHNAPPARVFAGDAGSHLLGFVSAALILQAIAVGPGGVLEWMLGTMMLGVVVFEGVFVTVVRIGKGIPWWRGSPDHAALRMRTLGFSRSQIDAIALAASCGCGAVAIALDGRPPSVVICGVGGMCVVAGVVWRWLLRANCTSASSA